MRHCNNTLDTLMSSPGHAIKNNIYLQYALCVGAGLSFTVATIVLLHHGHLFEDAYILFQYSHHLASGLGIVFDEASGPAEGATDFLWMIMLALLEKAGVSSGSAAAMLNGLGLSLTCFVIIRLGQRLDLAAVAAIALVLLSGGTAASFGGFSPLAFSAVFALLSLSVLEKRYVLMSVLALILALFRPDGVILAFGSVLVALLSASADERKKIRLPLLCACMLGLVYFFWRFHYFGLLLPLPLMVKSQTSTLFEGLDQNSVVIRYYGPLLLPFIYLLFTQKLGTIPWRNLLAVLLGPTLFFLALLFANQSQNVGYRFQFPIAVGMILFYLICMKEARKTHFAIRGIFLILPLIGVQFGTGLIKSHVQYLVNDDYINAFPQLLRKNDFKLENIAISEAGRFPYWYSARKMTDLVGLNSPQVVRDGPQQALLHERPELVFVHHADQYNTDGWAGDRDFVVVTDAKSIVTSENYSGKDAVFIAPHAALRYAIDNDFVAVFVKYGSNVSRFPHVYFLSRELDLDRFITTLEQSLGERLDYYTSEAYKKSGGY